MPEPRGGIRAVQAADVERVHEIAVAAWTPIFERTRIIMLDGRPAGFAVIEIEEGKPTGHIRTLGVVPEFGGQGLGCALCMDAFGLFRERGRTYARLTAAVGEVNEQTRQLCWNAGLYRELPSIEYYMLL